MIVVPQTQAQAADLALVARSAAACTSCPPDCDGMRWVWDPKSLSAARQFCPHASDRAREQAARHMLQLSGVPQTTIPIICPWLSGVTVVCPPWKAVTVNQELNLRRTTAGIVAGWIIEKQQPAFYLPYYLASQSWWAKVETWKTAPLVAFVGWHFRGLRQEHSCVFNDVLLSRLDTGLPTVVCCSADPSLLIPRWVTDEPALDAIQHPKFFVRAN